MKTILLATDGSPSAQKATGEAIELAGALDAQLRIVSSWTTPVFDYGITPAQYSPELDKAQQDGAQAAVDQALEAAHAAGVNATGEVQRGYAVDEICRAAEEADAEMIVLGAHGWGAMKRLLVGSVSTAVLHHASCPVLVVRGDSDEQLRETVGAASAHQGGTA